MSNVLVATVTEQLKTLPDDLQRQVLDFVYALKASIHNGVSGKHLLQFAGFIPQDDLLRMSQAIEEGCGRIDSNDW
jgi:hypothetical protein